MYVCVRCIVIVQIFDEIKTCKYLKRYGKNGFVLIVYSWDVEHRFLSSCYT